MRNRFSATTAADEPQPVLSRNGTTSEVPMDTVKKALGFRKTNDKGWITPATWKIENWRRLEAEREVTEHYTKSTRLMDQFEAVYKGKYGAGGKSKGAFVEEKGKEAERAALKGHIIKTAVWFILKPFCSSEG